MSNILVIDRDPAFRKSITRYFDEQSQLVREASDFDSALQSVEQNVFDVIISDASLNGGSLEDLLRAVRASQADSAVIVYSEIDALDLAMLAVREGASSIIQKPFSMPELGIHVAKALEIRSLKQEAQSLRGERDLIYRTDDMVGESPAIQEVFGLVNRVARADSSVLITGETGTGKELVAGAIHYNSERSAGPFVRVNCAALPEQLLESELFGYEKGAFTGADKLRIGRFEQADGGTIFLDEIADMSPYTQAKVLRVLQEKEFERLGANRTVRSDVRILSATNRDLLEEIKAGRFREDLYYRLNVVNIHLPPLRERAGDIVLLANFFLKKFCLSMNKQIRGFEPAALKLIAQYPWPGNIRELENTVERAVLLAEGERICREDLRLLSAGSIGLETGAADPGRQLRLPDGGVRLEEVERSFVLQALERCDWVQKEAAKLLGVSHRVLNYKIKRFGITHPRWKQNRQ